MVQWLMHPDRDGVGDDDYAAWLNQTHVFVALIEYLGLTGAWNVITDDLGVFLPATRPYDGGPYQARSRSISG